MTVATSKEGATWGFQGLAVFSSLPYTVPTQNSIMQQFLKSIARFVYLCVIYNTICVGAAFRQTGTPPQNIHRPEVTNGLLITRHKYQKGGRFHTSPHCLIFLLYKQRRTLPPCRQPGLCCPALCSLPGIFSKLLSPLFCLR